MSEERQDIEELTEIVHMEEDNSDTATPSSISSLNTEDIAALDKLFDQSQKFVKRGVWWRSPLSVTKLTKYYYKHC